MQAMMAKDLEVNAFCYGNPERSIRNSYVATTLVLILAIYL